jgi:hypothetical protein
MTDTLAPKNGRGMVFQNGQVGAGEFVNPIAVCDTVTSR